MMMMMSSVQLTSMKWQPSGQLICLRLISVIFLRSLQFGAAHHMYSYVNVYADTICMNIFILINLHMRGPAPNITSMFVHITKLCGLSSHTLSSARHFAANNTSHCTLYMQYKLCACKRTHLFCTLVRIFLLDLCMSPNCKCIH